MTSAPLIRFLMRTLPLQSVLHVVPHLYQTALKPVPTAGSVLAKILKVKEILRKSITGMERRGKGG